MPQKLLSKEAYKFMDKLLFRRILVAALSVLAIIYVAYLLISSNFEIYPTENVTQATVTDKIYTNAYIIRDETVINNDTSGVLSYTVSDSEEVKSDGEIAKVYSNESDAAAQSKANALQKQLDDLTALQNNNTTQNVGIDTINNSISDNIVTYLTGLNNGDLFNIDDNANKLIYSINQRQLYTGKIQNFNSEIASLQAQIDSLRSSSGESIGSVKSKKAGYFSSHCDGYENSIKYSDVYRLTLDDLKNIKRQSVSKNSAGKVISGLNWYVACEVSSDDATSLSLWDGFATVLFSDASTNSIPAKIERLSQNNKDGNALLILQCDYMNTDLIESRIEPVEIGLGTYTGLRVSRRAIHDDYVEKTTYDENDNAKVEKKKVQGVYVLYGSEVQFKQISILYADNDYVICDPDPKEGVLFNGETVSLYDQVILEGDDLYDGKVIK